jgi:peptidyl-prolyl cis-trans isomerase C
MKFATSGASASIVGLGASRLMRVGVIALTLHGLAGNGLAGSRAADAAPAADPTPRPAAPKPMPELLPNPSEMMRQMASELDKNPERGVLDLEKITITQGELADVIRTMPVSMASLGYQAVSRHALDTLVAQKAMVLSATREGLDKDATVIRKFNAMRDRALADAWLARQGDAAISEEKVRARYENVVAGRPGPVEVRVRLILVPTEDEARAIIDKARNGADFGELAKTYSKDGSASKGGDLGFAPRESLSPEIGTVAFALQLGEVTAFPMPSPLGYFVLRVEGRRQRGTPTLEEARPRLEGELRAEAMRNAVEYMMAHVKMAPNAKPVDAPRK